MELETITVSMIPSLLPAIQKNFDWAKKMTGANRTWDSDEVIKVIESAIYDGIGLVAYDADDIAGVVVFRKSRLTFNRFFSGVEVVFHVDSDITARKKISVIRLFLEGIDQWAKDNEIQQTIIFTMRDNPLVKRLMGNGYVENETAFIKTIGGN